MVQRYRGDSNICCRQCHATARIVMFKESSQTCYRSANRIEFEALQHHFGAGLLPRKHSSIDLSNIDRTAGEQVTSNDKFHQQFLATTLFVQNVDDYAGIEKICGHPTGTSRS